MIEFIATQVTIGKKDILRPRSHMCFFGSIATS